MSVRSVYAYCGGTSYVLDDSTVVQVLPSGKALHVTGKRDKVLGQYESLDEALAAAERPAGPGVPGRPVAGWLVHNGGA